MTWKFLILAACMSLLSGCLHFQTNSEIESEIISGTEDIYDYHLLLPRGVKHKSSNPMIVIFHGRGQDALRYIEPWLAEVIKRQLIVLAPEWETPNVEENVDVDALFPLIDSIAERYFVDPTRIYIAGVSAGGLITRWLLERYPGRWRGAMLIAHNPGMNWPQKVADLELPPIFFAMGELDKQSDFKSLKGVVKMLESEKKDVRLLMDPTAGHEHRETWTKEMLDWILKSA